MMPLILLNVIQAEFNRNVQLQSNKFKHALVGEKTDRPIGASCEHPWLGWVEGAVKHTLELVHFMASQNLDRHDQGICHQIL